MGGLRQSTSKRAKWVPALARAIGWKPQRLRNKLNKRGYKWPYTSELRGMKVCKELGLDISRYRPTEDAVGVDFDTLDKPVSAAPSKLKGNGSALATALPLPQKDQSRWSQKILSRLARLLPEGDTTKGKVHVRKILRAGGFMGKPLHVDEATALAIFQQANIPIDQFEYEHAPGMPGGPLIAPAATTYEELLQQYTAQGERVKGLVEKNVGLDARVVELDGIVRRMRTILLQYEDKILPEVKTKYGGLVEPLGYPIDALNIVRHGY